jgi:hypothetical protein
MTVRPGRGRENSGSGGAEREGLRFLLALLLVAVGAALFGVGSASR